MDVIAVRTGFDGDRGQDRGADRNSERTAERTSDRVSRARPPKAPAAPGLQQNQPSGPPPDTADPAPGESISKYQRYSQQPLPRSHRSIAVSAVARRRSAEPGTPIAATFPEDEPIFAATESSPSRSTKSMRISQRFRKSPRNRHLPRPSWNREFRRPEEAAIPALGWPGERLAAIEQDEVHEGEVESDRQSRAGSSAGTTSHEEHAPVFAAPGTLGRRNHRRRGSRRGSLPGIFR